MTYSLALGPFHPAWRGPQRFDLKLNGERIVDIVHPLAVHYVDGTNEVAAECARYTDLLRGHPLDLCCLGVGENGHLAFNDPPVADFDDAEDVKEVALDETSRRQQVGADGDRATGCSPDWTYRSRARDPRHGRRGAHER